MNLVHHKKHPLVRERRRLLHADIACAARRGLTRKSLGGGDMKSDPAQPLDPSRRDTAA